MSGLAVASERGPMTPVMYRVRDRFDELADTVTFTLEPEAEMVGAAAPGQFMMLWAFGVGEVPISVASIGGDGTLVHTIRAVGAVTEALCALRPGDQIGVRGPYGSSWPVSAALGENVLVVAGGLGLAPVFPIIEQVLADRENFDQCTVLVGARNPDLLIYRARLDELAADNRIKVEVIVDAAGPSWTGQVGLITKLIANAQIAAERTHAFLCGPEPMMRFGAMGIEDLGVARDRIWLSLERNMHCAIMQCGHCQLGPLFICRDGPVVCWPAVDDLLKIPER